MNKHANDIYCLTQLLGEILYRLALEEVHMEPNERQNYALLAEACQSLWAICVNMNLLPAEQPEPMVYDCFGNRMPEHQPRTRRLASNIAATTRSQKSDTNTSIRRKRALA